VGVDDVEGEVRIEGPLRGSRRFLIGERDRVDKRRVTEYARPALCALQ
jgi:hypothetical protein